MGTYNIPRNTKGEGRILMVFSTKALIYTGVGAFIGFIMFRMIFAPMKLTLVGIIVMALLAFLGFSIATFKIPDSDVFEITKNAGGLNIDEVILRIIKFKANPNRKYIYKRKGDNNANRNDS